MVCGCQVILLNEDVMMMMMCAGVHLLAVRRCVQSGAVHSAHSTQFSVDPRPEASCRSSQNEPRSRCASTSVVVGDFLQRRRRPSYDVDARRSRPVVRPDRAAAGRARTGQRRWPARLRQRLRTSRWCLGRSRTHQQFGQLHSLLRHECAVQIDIQACIQPLLWPRLSRRQYTVRRTARL